MSRAVSVPASQVRVDLGDGDGLADRDAISWQVSRSLSGGGLPGQVRSVSGSSVGSGSLVIPVDAATPWPGGVPGGSVEVDATHDAETLADQGPVGWREMARMRVRGTSWDSWLSPVRTVDVEDRVPRGPVDVPVDLGRAALDACCVIDQAARAAGYLSTPPAAPSSVVSLPLVGSLWGERGGDYRPSISDGARYRSSTEGVAMLTDSIVNPLQPIGDPVRGEGGLVPEGGGSGFAIAFTAAVFGVPSGTTSIRPVVSLYPMTNLTMPEISLSISASTGLLYLRISGFGSLYSITLPPYVTADGYPRRFVVTYLANHSTQWTGQWSVYMDGVLMGVATLTVTTARGGGLYGVSVAATPEGGVNGVQVGTSLAAADYGLLEQETALIGASGSPLEAIIEPTSGDAWAVIQEVSAATLGATWIDERGRLIYRGREALRTGRVVAEVDALDRLEGIPGAVSADEVADRVEVTYRPPVVTATLQATQTVWESSDVVRVAAGATVNLDRDLDVATSSTQYSWRPVEDTTVPAGTDSRYAAWTAPPGESGSAPPADALGVSSTMLSPTRVRITIQNRTGSALWVYRIIARARLTVAAGAPVTLTSGVPERDAQNPLSVDLGAWVQDHHTARSILDWLAGETSAPQPILSDIRVAADLDLRLADTIMLRIESMTGDPAHRLALKALITGTDVSSSAGQLDQRLTLTVLAPTVADVAAYYERQAIATVADVATHWTGLLGPSVTPADIAAWMARGGLYA